jgi:hypothetical protein
VRGHFRRQILKSQHTARSTHKEMMAMIEDDGGDGGGGVVSRQQ